MLTGGKAKQLKIKILSKFTRNGTRNQCCELYKLLKLKNAQEQYKRLSHCQWGRCTGFRKA